MSILTVDFSMDDNLHRSIGSAKRALNKRIDDYEGIERKVRRIPSSTNNCANCAYYIKKKTQQLYNKVDKLENFRRNVDGYIDNVISADKRVASRIKTEGSSFKKHTGIGKQSKSICASVCESIDDFFREVVEGIKNFGYKLKEVYEQNKYWVQIVWDTALVVAAVLAIAASGGTPALVIGMFAASDAMWSLFYDAQASCAYYKYHDKAEADRLSGQAGVNGYLNAGNLLNEACGVSFFDEIFGGIYAVGEITESVMYMNDVLKATGLNKIKRKTWFNGNRHKIKWRTHFNWDAFKKLINLKKIRQRNSINYIEAGVNTVDVIDGINVIGGIIDGVSKLRPLGSFLIPGKQCLDAPLTPRYHNNIGLNQVPNYPSIMGLIGRRKQNACDFV